MGLSRAWLEGAGVAAACLALTLALARAALALGWRDRREGAWARKPRRAPVPTVGGLAVVLALVLGRVAFGGEMPGEMPGAPWAALVAALALGTWDDLRPGGLSARAKLLGQLGVAAVLWAAGADPATAAWAIVAMNAVNTWDNADGAAGGLACVALVPGRAAWAALGFLPANLTRVARAVPPGEIGAGEVGAGEVLGAACVEPDGPDEPAEAVEPASRVERVPRAYLGDAGAHALGLLCALSPASRAALAVPLADLLRLAWLRWRAGGAPWRGDRRHLAHRLHAAGLGPRATALTLGAACALPRLAFHGLGGGSAGLAGAAVLGALLVAALVQGTPEP